MARRNSVRLDIEHPSMAFMSISRLDRCRNTLRGCALALLLAASHGMAAVAGAAGTDASKASGEPHLIDSGDHVHVLRVKGTDPEGKVTVLIRIDDGYHINANPASYPYLIPTSLVFKEIPTQPVTYPAATRFKPKFVSEPIDVYQGTLAIMAFLPKDALARIPLLHATLTLQACTDVICLPPAAILLTIHS